MSEVPTSTSRRTCGHSCGACHLVRAAGAPAPAEQACGQPADAGEFEPAAPVLPERGVGDQDALKEQIIVQRSQHPHGGRGDRLHPVRLSGKAAGSVAVGAAGAFLAALPVHVMTLHL